MEMKLVCRAILLLGPTGAGKTPLGEAMEKTGFHGYRAAHFDFGVHLRAAVAHPADYALLTADDVAVLDRKLRENALLEDNEFYIAEKIMASFIETTNLGFGEYIILNGLPRHVGQAKSVSSLVAVEEVIYLDCSTNIVRYRIKTDKGGDRDLRNDDSALEIERKLKIFSDRTMPLLNFYRSQNVPIRSVRIEKGIGLSEVLTAVLP